MQLAVKALMIGSHSAKSTFDQVKKTERLGQEWRVWGVCLRVYQDSPAGVNKMTEALALYNKKQHENATG